MNPTTLPLPASLRAGERGSAMMMAMFCILMVVLASVTIMTVAKQELGMSRYLVDRTKARAVANGGMEKTLGWLSKNQSQIQNIPANIATGTLGNGSYVVTSSSVGGSVVELVSTARVGATTAETRVYVSCPNTDIAMAAAIFSNGNIAGNGSYTVNGGIYSNQNVNTGGSSTINGNVYASGTATAMTAAGYSVHSSAPKVTFPLVDFNYYYAIAQANGQVITASDFNKNKTATYTPPGGVLWVNANGSDIKLNGNYTITVNGTLVVYNGNLNVIGNAILVVTGNTSTNGVAPAILINSGSLSLGGGSSITGCVYVNAGTINMQGSANALNCNMVSWGDVSPGGTPTVNPPPKNDVALDPKNFMLTLLTWLE